MKYLFNTDGTAEVFEDDAAAEALEHGWSETKVVVTPTEPTEDTDEAYHDSGDIEKIAELTTQVEEKDARIKDLEDEITLLKKVSNKESGEAKGENDKSDDYDSMSEEDLRKLGKEKKIKSFHLLSIEKLKAKLRG